jgi:hypothetical protein
MKLFLSMMKDVIENTPPDAKNGDVALTREDGITLLSSEIDALDEQGRDELAAGIFDLCASVVWPASAGQ